MKHCFLAIAPCYWGRGSNPEEARKHLLRAGAMGRDKWFLILVLGDDTAEINNMGSVIYEPDAEWLVVGGSKGWREHSRAVEDRGWKKSAA